MDRHHRFTRPSCAEDDGMPVRWQIYDISLSAQRLRERHRQARTANVRSNSVALISVLSIGKGGKSERSAMVATNEREGGEDGGDKQVYPESPI
jgi:hypothetical protein